VITPGFKAHLQDDPRLSQIDMMFVQDIRVQYAPRRESMHGKRHSLGQSCPGSYSMAESVHQYSLIVDLRQVSQSPITPLL
jgi:hypothetical protein